MEGGGVPCIETGTSKVLSKYLPLLSLSWSVKGQELTKNMGKVHGSGCRDREENSGIANEKAPKGNNEKLVFPRNKKTHYKILK